MSDKRSLLDFDVAEIQRITGINKDEWQELNKYKATLTLPEHILVQDIAMKLYSNPQLRPLMTKGKEAEYRTAMEVLTLAKLKNQANRVDKMQRSTPEERLIENERIIAKVLEKKKRNAAPKAVELIKRWDEIHYLKKNPNPPNSWRDIAEFLKTKYPKTFPSLNPTYLRTVYRDELARREKQEAAVEIEPTNRPIIFK